MKNILFITLISSLWLYGCNSTANVDQQYQALSDKIDNLTTLVNQQTTLEANQNQSTSVIEKTEKLQKDHHALLDRLKAIHETDNKILDKMNTLTPSEKKKANSPATASQEKDVLYEAKDNVIATVDDKTIIGAMEWVSLPDFKIAANGRIDTGAATTSINAHNIEEFERDGKKWVRFDIPDTNGNPHKIEAKFVGYDNIIQSSMESKELKETRTYVSLKLKIGNISKYAILNLTNRSHMSFPILIGREFLKDYAVVDVGRQYIHKKPKADIYIDTKNGAIKKDKDYSKYTK